MEKIADEFDKFTNTRTRTGFVDDKLVIRKDADISPNIDYATLLRNDDQYSSDGIKKGFFHAAHIPEVVIVELMQIGVDVYRASAKEILAGLRRLNKDHLITTRKRV
jgi:hypothetical protein